MKLNRMVSKQNIKYVLAVLLSLTLYSNTIAQKFYAQVGSKVVQVGQMFEVAFVINASASEFSPPSFADFEIAGGPNQSSSVQVINGQMTQNITLTYVLVPKKEGKLVIGAATINSNGQRLESSPITIEVVKNGATQSTGSPAAAAKSGGADIFIRTILSKSKCFLGEQITISQKVYSRLQIIGFQKFNPPTYEGFWSQTLPSTSGNQLVVENVDGVNYYTYELFRNIATPNKSGKLLVNLIDGDVVVRKQSNAKPRNVFEQFFGNGGYEDVAVKAKSSAVYLDVMELPKDGKPENFNGAVGSFNYRVEMSKQTVKANDAFNLKLTISGKGNIKLIDAPKLALPESFEVYEPKVSETAASKTFDYLVIPRQEGQYVLDNLDFSYFNLESKKYITIPSPHLEITVLQADQNSAGAQVYNPQNQIKETENDIRYIKKGGFELTKSETEFFNSIVHLLLLILPFILLIGGLLYRNMYLKNNSNTVFVKQRKAAKLAKKQLVIAEKLMSQNKKDEFYTEILRSINNYISYKLNIPIADVSKESIKNYLLEKQIEVVKIDELIKTVETSEYAKYAPGAVSGNLKEVYDKTVNLIIEIENQLNSKKA